MKITMLGVGDGFSKSTYNNNALIQTHTENVLIDCGITAIESLHEINIALDMIDSVFLTHIHFDHSGGMEPLAIYSKYFLNKKIRLVVPKPIEKTLWENSLKGSIDNDADNCHSLNDYFDVVNPEENESFILADGLNARWIETNHMKGKFSCGLVINEKFLYTSDMTVDIELLETLVSKGVQIIYHDCNFINGTTHSLFKDLKKYPDHIKEKIYLMHHGRSRDDDISDGEGMTFLFQHEAMVVE
jgi:ribonuclease BN (tRNA processing enzyme)